MAFEHALVRVSLRGGGTVLQFPLCEQRQHVLLTAGEPMRLPWDLFIVPTCLWCAAANPWQLEPQPFWLCRVTSTS